MLAQPENNNKSNLNNESWGLDFWSWPSWALSFWWPSKKEDPPPLRITGMSLRGKYFEENFEKYFKIVKENGGYRPDIDFFIPENPRPAPSPPWKWIGIPGRMGKTGPPPKIYRYKGGKEPHPKKPDWTYYYDNVYEVPKTRKHYSYWTRENTPPWPLNPHDPWVWEFMEEYDQHCQPWTLAERYPELKGIYGGWFDEYRGPWVPLAYGINCDIVIKDKGPLSVTEMTPFGWFRPYFDYLSSARHPYYRLEFIVWLSYRYRNHSYTPWIPLTGIDDAFAAASMGIHLYAPRAVAFPVKYKWEYSYAWNYQNKLIKPQYQTFENWMHSYYIPNQGKEEEWLNWDNWKIWWSDLDRWLMPQMPYIITGSVICGTLLMFLFAYGMNYYDKVNGIEDRFNLNEWGREQDKMYAQLAEARKKEEEHKERLYWAHQQKILQKKKEAEDRQYELVTGKKRSSIIPRFPEEINIFGEPD
jgi:hypothetical protein